MPMTDRDRLSLQIRKENETENLKRQALFILRALARHSTENGMSEIRQMGGDGDGTPIGMFAKAATPANSLDVAWQSAAGQAMAQSYLGSIAYRDALTLVLRYCRQIPEDLPNVLVASGTTADVVNEGAPKAVRHLDIFGEEVEDRKTAALVVMTKELLREGNTAGFSLFERELTNAVTAAANKAFAMEFVDSNSPTATPGANAFESLQNALAQAEPSRGYVVLADWSLVPGLAMQSDGRMSVSGGEFVPDLHIIGYEAESSDPQMIVIPAEHCAVWASDFVARSASHASVMMADDPTAEGELTSLWQTNSAGLLVERSYRIVTSASAVIVE
ncbi:hypothetical protein M0G74_10985 [Microbulbifer sp. CAU 1566]|uniref:hypothetical protein n=1 Tax=Microbulbifer sp. CAU 1566 TaxID=2933269 RepID=UPI002002E5F2|nr:hypothetical protein [Microbulbifer sp. CAU 1566]MCK7597794.1 hypothetical protein [Microbulbifer sp. CAU 1566]